MDPLIVDRTVTGNTAVYSVNAGEANVTDDPVTPKTFGDFFLSHAQGQGQEMDFGTLASLLAAQTPTIQRRWFRGETIHIDGYIFEDCRFDGCQLVTEIATFVFRRCFLSPNCRIYFRGPALKTVRLLMHVLQLQQRIKVRADELGIYATLNADGTFTLE